MTSEGMFAIGNEAVAYDYHGHLLHRGGVEPLIALPVQHVTSVVERLYTHFRPASGGENEVTS